MAQFNKKVWQTVSVQPEGCSFAVYLDKRGLMTPGRAPLHLPTESFARGIAAEWDSVTDKVNPAEMPLTRAANSAIDKVTPQHKAVADMLTEYGGTDLLCYRAETPAELVAHQAEHWDEHLAWVAQEFGAALKTQAGVMPIAQPQDSLAQLGAAVAACDAFFLTALHDLVTISGSLVLGLAVLRGRLNADEAFDLSRLDAAWQAELWGEDDEAQRAAANHRRDMRAAAHMLELLKGA
ncbi:MAG: ATP12 family protein [Paracoccaceae bacterium]